MNIDSEKEALEEATNGTAAEMQFLSGLGTFSEHGPLIGRRALLEGYLQGCELRRVWGKMDRQQIVEAAKAELEAEKLKGE